MIQVVDDHPLIQGHEETRAAGEGAGPWRIAGWLVEPGTGRIARNGEEIQLEPKVMDVLVHLSRRRGEVVSREELEAAVWTGRVVSYDAVTNAIIKLRRAFGDDSRHPRVIETLSKKGYRLIAEVEPLAAPVGPPPAVPATADARPLYKRMTFAAALPVLLAIVLATAWWLREAPGPDRAAAPVTDRASIVVLPFENIAADSTQDYFSNGITEDLITELSKIPELAVIARGSAFAYGSEDSLEHVRRELGVRYVLRGSVRREGARVRINAQLIDAVDGRHLWAERYDATLEDTLALQASITREIADVLEVRLATDPGGVAGRYTASVEAYDQFLRGLDHYGRRSPDDMGSAKAFYARAIALDPKFARAYANLGLVHLQQVIGGWDEDPQASLDQAQRLARQALSLDDGLAEVYFVSAFVALFRHAHEDAIRELDRALALRPSYADAHALLAYVLYFAGRPEQARPALERAIRLNPRVPSAYLMSRSEMDFTQGRYQDAIAGLERALEISPASPRMHLLLAAAYAHAGRTADARWMTEQLTLLYPTVALSRLPGTFPFKDHAHLEHLLDGLRKAGLPE